MSQSLVLKALVSKASVSKAVVPKALVPKAGLWVPAAPFRAYARYLIEAAGVPWRVVAQRAGVSANAMRTLLFGRDGRLRRQVDRRSATRLLGVTSSELEALRRQSVAAQPTQVRIKKLRAAGLSGVDVAKLLGVDAESVRRWEEGFLSNCPALVEAQARAAVAALDDQTR